MTHCSRRAPLLVALLLSGLAASNASAQGVQPGPEHEILKLDVGVWDADMKVWPAGPQSEPIQAKGVETNKMLGGLWVISEFEGDFAGAAFHGHGQFGYDPVKKAYVGTWIDNMTPNMMTMQGAYDAEKKTFTYQGKMYVPELQQEVGSKNVTVYVDQDTRRMEMYAQQGDEWVKNMEIQYKRRK